MAPEVVRYEQYTVDALFGLWFEVEDEDKIDIYAMALIMYYIFSGA